VVSRENEFKPGRLNFKVYSGSCPGKNSNSLRVKSFRPDSLCDVGQKSHPTNQLSVCVCVSKKKSFLRACGRRPPSPPQELEVRGAERSLTSSTPETHYCYCLVTRPAGPLRCAPTQETPALPRSFQRRRWLPRTLYCAPGLPRCMTGWRAGRDGRLGRHRTPAARSRGPVAKLLIIIDTLYISVFY
jgi:hypothetical protein